MKPTLVKVILPPPHTPELSEAVGFVNNPPDNPEDVNTNTNLEIGILTETGLQEIYLIPTACLAADDSPETAALYAAYRHTLEEIKSESDERYKKQLWTTNHLARKYGITPDEVHGVYKAMLHYEEHYDTNRTGRVRR